MAKLKKNQEKICKLVLVDRGIVFCDSRMIAEKFGVEHKKVVRTIELVISKNNKIEGDLKSYSKNDFAPVFIKFEDEYHGQRFTAYRMNKTAFMLVAMRFETDAAFIWQSKFAAAFATMERTISQIANQKANQEWLEARQAGKIVRRAETDTIQQFVEYAKNQGSTNAVRYYSNISKMQNQALFLFDQKYKNIREILDIDQLSTVKIADKIISKAIVEGMETGLHYKAIYQMAKSRIETFATLHGKSAIPEYGERQAIAM